MERHQEVTDVLAYRQSVYDLLRRIFLWEMPLELFAELVATAKKEPDENELTGPSEAALKNSLREVSVDNIPATHRDIQIEYTRLFLGPRHLPAPPYESVYRSPQGLMMQDSTMEVRSLYLKNGFRVARINQEPDDSIGIELEFMCALSRETSDAYLSQDKAKLERLVSTQLEFCELHLSKWVPQFCADIIDNTQFEFWKGVASLTRCFLEQDAVELDRLKNLLESPGETNLVREVNAAL